MQVTKRGLTLANQLSRFFTKRQYNQVAEICSVIARHAKTHCRLQEIACSVEMTEKQQARHDKRDAAIEARITELVRKLPKSKNGYIVPVFAGDPRGYTVKLGVPNAPRDGNTWGLAGEFGI